MKAKILLFWMISYLLGCFLAPVAPVLDRNYLVISLMLITIAFLFTRKPWFFAAIFALAILILSIWRFQYRVDNLSKFNFIASQNEIDIEAMVDDLPQKALHGDKVRLKVVSKDNSILGQKIYGYFTDASSLKYSDVIVIRVKIKPFQDSNRWRLMDAGLIGESSVKEYKIVGRRTDFLALLKGGLLAIRKAFNESLTRALPEKEAGLASGIIMGEKAMISPDMQNYLKASGTTHIVALSGYNITIILGAIIMFRKKMTRLMGLILPIILIVLFTVMTGGAPSLVRAAIMGSMPLAASYLYRESNNFIAIMFSATLMSIFNPLLPLFDVGFQLSFMAFVGILYIAPFVSKLFIKINFRLSSVLAETLGAQISTFPLISYYFGVISIISPLTNFIILGIMPTCMLLSFLTGFTTILSPILGKIISLPTYLLLYFVNKVIEWSGGFAWASAGIKIENPWWILIIYLLIFDIWFFLHKKVVSVA